MKHRWARSECVSVYDPVAAAALVVTLRDGKERDAAVMDIIRYWAPAAPAEVAAWVAQFPQGDLRRRAIENVLEVWERENVFDAQFWFDQPLKGIDLR